MLTYCELALWNKQQWNYTGNTINLIQEKGIWKCADILQKVNFWLRIRKISICRWYMNYKYMNLYVVTLLNVKGRYGYIIQMHLACLKITMKHPKNVDVEKYRLPTVSSQSLTYWSRDKMAAVSQTTLSNAFSWMKMLKFRLRFHWSLFLRLQLTINQHWLR